MRRLIDKLKILVIDDDKNLCENIEKILSFEGYSVKTAFDGPGALKIIQSEKIHIVILDLIMPKMSGIDVFKKIRNIDPNIKIIILTGYPTIETAVTTLRGEASDYITKPFKNENLLKVVKAAVIKTGLFEDPLNRLDKQIGMNIKNYRMKKSLMLKDLAEQAGLSTSLISQLENGKNAASILTLYKIAQVLGLKITDLVEGL
ncbi:MAG: response regulator [bacterium]|nr:response regulator [bacterium]